MAYSKEIYDKAVNIVAQRRRDAETEAKHLKEQICATTPRALECDRIIHSAIAKLAMHAAIKNLTDEQVSALKAEGKEAERELAQILEENGVHSPDFSPAYTCTLCEDTGIVDHHTCSCITDLMRDLSAKEFSKTSGMEFTRFEDMDLKYYSDVFNEEDGCSPREFMSEVLNYCKNYAETFHAQAENLLLFGTTGSGKTHTALAIAGIVAKKGFCPVYHSAQQIFHKLEREHFNREAGDTESMLLNCDLLVLDDLGTEMTTAFTNSALYSIINGRMIRKKPTIISTNLGVDDWAPRYGDAVASRVLGTYYPLQFQGADIRQCQMEERFHE